MDEYYINKVRTGDTDAFSYFVEKYKKVAFSIALKILKNQQDAEEIVQDAFLKAYKALDNFKGNAKFSTWLYKIVFNSSVSKARLTTSDMFPLEETLNDTVDFQNCNGALQNLQQENRKRYIREVLQNLDELDYTILTLFYFEEKSLKNIG
jgi:RNA polymerase sigma factor (sigma-70 family)